MNTRRTLPLACLIVLTLALGYAVVQHGGHDAIDSSVYTLVLGMATVLWWARSSRPDLGGRVKSRNLSTVQIPHFPAATETGEFYFGASSVRKSVCSFVRQLRGPHLRTCA